MPVVSNVTGGAGVQAEICWYEGITRNISDHRRDSARTPAPHVLDDGRHTAYLTAIDVPARTITFDVIQFLTGEAADEAFHQDHPEIEGGVPNDHYIRNENTRLRTLPVPVRVVWLGEGAQLESISFEELPAYVAADPEPGDQYLWHDPFWLTVHGDRVESIVEQYIA